MRARPWRLSRRLVWGFSLLAAIPILVVGIGARQYTRSLLQRSFDQRVDLTRRLVSAWSAQLATRAREAARLCSADPGIALALSRTPADRGGLMPALERIAVHAAVGGIDLILKQEDGLLLSARAFRPTHFGFPSRAPRPSPDAQVWPAHELGALCYGVVQPLAGPGGYLIAAYHLINDSLLTPITGAGTFFAGSWTVDGAPLVSRPLAVGRWPDLGEAGEARLDAGAETYAVGRVGPFYFGLSLSESRGALRRLDLFLVLATGIAVAVAVLAARRVAYSAARPVEELAQTVGRWGRGAPGEPLITFAEGETATLADAFETLRRELASAERRLADAARSAGWQEMARKVAHEIKNPLTPIRVTMEDLARRAARNPAEAAAHIPEATRLVAEEIAVLRRIVDAFTHFARLPEPQPRPVDLNRVVGDSVSLMAGDRPRVDFQPAGSPALVRADPQLLGEALNNLIKNAIEAAGADGSVAVRVHGDREALEVEIADSGAGFPEDLLARGPRPYFTTKREGTGLGLVISQRIVSDLGGQMRLSNGDSGARVHLLFHRAGGAV